MVGCAETVVAMRGICARMLSVMDRRVAFLLIGIVKDVGLKEVVDGLLILVGTVVAVAVMRS